MRCNFCFYQDTVKLGKQMEANTGRFYEAVAVQHPVDGFPAGVDIYLHAVGDHREEGFVGWVASLPSECACSNLQGMALQEVIRLGPELLPPNED